MPQPNLIHPVWVTIERLDRSELVMDAQARIPVHGPRTNSGSVVTIQAQVKWERRNDPEPEGAGDRKRNTGYILCRTKDMDSMLGAGVEFKRGDRITTMGKVTGLDVYITKSEPMGHYPDQSGQTLIRFYFEDRSPTRQRGDL